MKRSLLLLAILFTAFASAFAQTKSEDEKQIRSIFDEALTNSHCYNDLRYLCKKIGHRLSGSPQAQEAVEWGKALMESYEFDSVWLQETMVPKWTRGDVEEAAIVNSKFFGNTNLKITALGSSVGTSEKGITAEVIEVYELEELEALGAEKIKGKIIFFNRPMEAKLIDTHHAYGGCVDQRSAGPSRAAELGAVAALVRSMNLFDDEHPHTGGTWFKEGVKPIPAAALSTNDADKLSEALKKKPRLQVRIKLSCQLHPDVKSYNVIGELKGSEHPDEIILVSGHLDSWDVGEGAHDDGTGVVQSIEVLRLFKELGIRPKRTIRCVLWMNEENGTRGAKTYAKEAWSKGENHIVAMESDRGGFTPRGFTMEGDEEKIAWVRSWAKLLEPYNLHLFEKGFSGVDVRYLAKDRRKMEEEDICFMGLLPDPQRYFKHHHAETDVFEAVNKRELELGAASMTAMVYLIDKYGFQKKPGKVEPPVVETN